MGNGCGAHGHRAQHHVELEPGPEQQIHVLDRFMLGCHAREVDQKLKAAKVS